MSGAGFALLAALSYGLAGVTIVKGKTAARGDNGVFLSVLMTALVSGLLWLGSGQGARAAFSAPGAGLAISAFVAAGLFSMVLGRTTMYRATEQIGPVAASLLRRLTPVFALPIAVVVLSEVPSVQTLLGSVLVILAVVIYIGKPAQPLAAGAHLGWVLGIGSAGFYAMSYVLRSLGLDSLPDAAFGTLIGALAGALWMLIAASLPANRRVRLSGLFTDRGPWHVLTALSLSAGQLCQFFALKSAPVVLVATLGALEVFFAALFGALLTGRTGSSFRRIMLPAAVAVAGTALLMG